MSEPKTILLALTETQARTLGRVLEASWQSADHARIGALSKTDYEVVLEEQQEIESVAQVLRMALGRG